MLFARGHDGVSNNIPPFIVQATYGYECPFALPVYLDGKRIILFFILGELKLRRIPTANALHEHRIVGEPILKLLPKGRRFEIDEVQGNPETHSAATNYKQGRKLIIQDLKHHAICQPFRSFAFWTLCLNATLRVLTSR